MLGVMGKYVVPRRNVSGDILLEMSSHMEIVTGNCLFQEEGNKQVNMTKD